MERVHSLLMEGAVVVNFFENSNFSAIQHINEGCINLNLAQGEVCDPPDLWQANVQLIDGSDGIVISDVHKLGRWYIP